MGRIEEERFQSREAVQFMRAVIRFATAGPTIFKNRSFTLSEYFEGVFIGPEVLRKEFVRWKLSLVPKFTDLRVSTLSTLRLLQRDLSRDLTEMADATGVWRQLLPVSQNPSPRKDAKRRHIVRMELKGSGKVVSYDVTDAVVILPEPLRKRIQAHLPRHEFTGSGRIEPVLRTASIRQILYYSLALALSQGVLLQCRKCAHCGMLVVHQQRPSILEPLWFCSGVDRDCKTAYHNARKSKADKSETQRAWRARRGSKLRSQRQLAQTIGALERFLAAALASPDDDNVKRTVRRLGGGGLEGWKLVRRLLAEIGREGCTPAVWDSLSRPAKEVIAAGWAVPGAGTSGK